MYARFLAVQRHRITECVFGLAVMKIDFDRIEFERIDFD